MPGTPEMSRFGGLRRFACSGGAGASRMFPSLVTLVGEEPEGAAVDRGAGTGREAVGRRS